MSLSPMNLRSARPRSLAPIHQVYLNKPLGVKFARGNDGGAYVVRSDATLGNTTDDIQVRAPGLVSTVPWD